MGYKRKAIVGISWLGALQILSQAIALIKLVILSRILSPSDFGLFALVTATLITYETLSESGFSYAVIHAQTEIKKIAKTLLFLNLTRGALLTILILVTTPFIAYFFKSDALVLLLLLASFVPLLRGAINPYTINFQKELDFKKYVIFQFIPTIVNAIFSILLVLIFKSISSLVVALLFSTFSEVVTSYLLTERNFSKPVRIKDIKKLFSFGKWITAGGLVIYLTTQIDNLIIGKVLGTTALGLYDISFRLSNLAFTQITDVIAKVMLPIYAKISNDKKRVNAIFIQNVVATSVPAFFMSAIFFLFPAQVLQILFGSQWTSAAVILQILSLYGFLRAAIGPIGPLLMAGGKPKILTRINLINFVAILVLIFPLLKIYGINGVAIAMLLGLLITLPFYFYEGRKYLNSLAFKKTY